MIWTAITFFIVFSVNGEVSERYCLYQLNMDSQGLITVIDKGPPIFSDGFEIGSTMAWKAVLCKPLGSIQWMK